MAVPNFPKPPGRNIAGGAGMTFPSDLITSGREYYTEINFQSYEYATATGLGALSFGGGVRLPIPRRINDNESIIWEEWSGTQAAPQILGAGAAIAGTFGAGAVARVAQGLGGVMTGLTAGVDMAGTFTGQSVNPFQFMMFKRPNFKEYTFSWILAPNTREDSENLKDIINKCKKSALPSTGSLGGGLMKYPDIAMVRFRPDDYLFKLKPCAILGIQVDYTGAGPSFFKSGAPTIVTLTMQLKELQLQKKDTYVE
jgi:hypothetical protein